MFRWSRLATVSLLTTLVLLASAQSAMAEDWPSVHGGPGQNPSRTFDPGNDFLLAWESTTVSPSAPDCVVTAGQRLFSFVSDEEDPGLVRLAAFNVRDGGEIWTTALFAKPAVTCPATDGDRVYVGSGWRSNPPADPAFSAYSVDDGRELWRYAFGPQGGSIQGSPTVLNGRVYVQAVDSVCGYVYEGGSGCTFGFDSADGTLVSRTAVSSTHGAPSVVGGPVLESGVSIGTNPDVSVHVANNWLIARRLTDGSEAWRDDAETGVRIGEDGVAYYVREPAWPHDGPRVVVARQASTGAVLWSHDLAIGQYAYEMAASASRIFVSVGFQDGNRPGRVIALDRATGSQLWSSASASSGYPQGLFALGDKVYAKRQVFDAATGTLTATGLPEDASPFWGGAYADGTFYFWRAAYNQPSTLVAYRDTNAPAVTLSAPGDGTYSTSATPTFTWSSTDGPGSGVETQALDIDGLGSTPLTAQTRSWQPTSPLPDGVYAWRLRATDRLHNTTTTPTRTLVVDTTNPSAFELAVPDGAVLLSLAETRLRWSPAQDGTAGVDRYEILIDGRRTANVAPTVCDVSACTGPVLPIADGQHTWAVRAVDRAGLSFTTAERHIDVAIPPRAAISAVPSRVLTGNQVRLEPAAVDDNGAIQRIDWDLNNDGAYETSTTGVAGTSTSFATAGVHTVSARVVDNSGLQFIVSTTVDVRPTPPAGEIGVSINNGDIATNDPDVTLTLVWPKFADRALISNDGGFGAQGGTQTLPLATTVPWRLRSSGAERLPKTMYLRFKGADVENVNYTDDIILDESAPALTTAGVASSRVINAPISAEASSWSSRRQPRLATARKFRIRIVGSDKASGIARVVVAPTKSMKHASTITLRSRTKLGIKRLDKTVTVRTKQSPKWVRVLDSAGNPSRWKRL